jgi:hypothetical protein
LGIILNSIAMARYRNKMGNDYNIDASNPDERYNLAYKRVKRIKGFYTHLVIFIVVNSIVIINNSFQSSNTFLWSWKNFSTALFWGIGLLAHGLSVFGRNIFFGKNWEEKKIQELMEKDKSEKWE